ncbi:sterol desaturase family protein [Flavicella marina]|uniref:sterol desaturase family protein n=1 Tax=Flavicella marina TaxID=1475951 RepID=UPI001264B703|nr:sterol desaturase family protein [Flavicella marina]
MEYKEIIAFLNDGLQLVINYLTSPGKRTYFLYLISSLLLAAYVFYRSNRKGSFLNYILNKKVWLSKSAFVDYSLIIFNSFFKLALIAPFLLFGLKLAFNTNDFLLSHFGYASFSLSTAQTLILYTISLSVLNDFMTYVVHLIFHKVPFLWEFHKIHHSATSMNPFTQYRLHPIELLANNIKGILVFGVTTGIFDYLSDHQISKWTFLGVNVFSFAFYAWGANLRHSHVRLKFFNFLEYIFISPVQHQVHHSDNPKHFDKNLGSRLAIWDWMFGTLIRSNQVEKVTFGLGKEDNKNYNSFLKNLWMPFKNIYKLLFERKSKVL